MLQIDHVYEFLYQNLFNDFDLYHCPHGVVETRDLVLNDIHIFTSSLDTTKKIFFYDQEPLLDKITDRYLKLFEYPNSYSFDQIIEMTLNSTLPFDAPGGTVDQMKFHETHPECFYKQMTLVTSEKSPLVTKYCKEYGANQLYYFFHGFAALDWYRGYYALNYSKPVKMSYQHDFVSYNRIINNDRSYRIYWVSKLAELDLLSKGQVSFNVTDNHFDDWQDEVADPNTKLSELAKQHAEYYLTNIDKLVIDSPSLPGSASADILRDVDALWNVVTETVFYYDKLHLTEKIFKPIVSKQPFMLIAAPGNLEYLRSYGFKTFEGIIDESYDTIQDNDQRIEAVAAQLHWYCNLSQEEKSRIIERLAPIVEYNFHHFYGAFRHIITKELLTNCQTLFKEIGYDDKTIAYNDIYRVLTN